MLQALIEHGDQYCPICRDQIKIILRIPDEVVKLTGEGIGRIFAVTEGVVIEHQVKLLPIVLGIGTNLLHV